MTDVNLKLFTASGDQESRTLGRDVKGNKVNFTPDANEASKYINDVQFNSKTGTLSIIKLNGEILEITGFLTQDQLGKGERGTRGRQGKEGDDARPGKEGREGDEGCQGNEGKAGPNGKEGRDGGNGPVGIPGKTGCDGLTGDPGLEGIEGDKGFQGELGRKGIDCIFGKIGPIGPKPKATAWIGETEPTDDYVIWAFPFSGDVPVLEDPGALAIVANNIDQTLVQTSGNTYTSKGNIVIS